MAMNTTPAGGKFEPGGDIGAIISKDNFIMDGHHRIQAYHLLGRTEIPIYRIKLWRKHGFCWKLGLEIRRKLRLKKW